MTKIDEKEETNKGGKFPNIKKSWKDKICFQLVLKRRFVPWKKDGVEDSTTVGL